MRRPALTAIVLLAAGIRFFPASAIDLAPHSDGSVYMELAQNLSRFSEFSSEGALTAYRPPGYPLLLSLFVQLDADPLTMIRAMQACAGALSTLLVFALGSYWFNRNAGLLAAALWAVYPADVVYAGYVMPETVFVTFFLGSVWLFLTAGEGHGRAARPFRYAIASGLLAACTLMKPFLLPICSVLPAAALLRGEKSPWGADRGVLRRRWKLPVAMALVSAVLIVPWTLRNTLTFGAPSISLNGGVNLLIGNNPEATGAWKLPSGSGDLLEFRDEAVRDRLAQREAVAWIASNPGAFLKLLPKKLAHFVSSEAPLAIALYHRDGSPRAGSYARQYMSTPAPLHLLLSLPYVLIVLAGVAGITGTRPRSPSYPTMTAAVAGYWIFVTLIFFGNHRFHHPVMPFLAIGAAALLTDLPGAAGRLRSRRGLLAAVGCALFLAVLIAEWATAVKLGTG